MKNTFKIFVLILVSLLLLTTISCDAETFNDIPAISEKLSVADSTTPQSTATPSPAQSPEQSEPVASSTPPEPQTEALLTFDDAVTIYNAWLDEHPDLDSYVTNPEYERPDEPPPSTYWLFGEPYYELYVSSDKHELTEFLDRVLVHEETGELLSIYVKAINGNVTALNDNVIIRIETLDDWYNGNHTESDTAALTAGEALSIYNNWYDAHSKDHADFPAYHLEPQERGRYIIFGEEYYYFGAVEYWFNILVHKNTGEMLYLMIDDGLYPATSIITLDDWYNSI